MNKLPVGAILGQAFLLPVTHWRDFSRIALAPLVYAAIGLSALYFLLPAKLSLVSNVLSIFAIYLVAGLLTVAFIVSWHRLVLLGRTSTDRNWFPLFGKRDLRFIGYVVLFAIIFFVVFVITSFFFSAIGQSAIMDSQVQIGGAQKIDIEALQSKMLLISLGLNLLFLFLFFFVCHWLLVFPGITVDEPTPHALAVNLVEGNQARFYLVVVVVLIVVYALEWACSYIAGTILVPSEGWFPYYGSASAFLFQFIYFLVGLAGSAVFASALSICFRKLKEFADAQPASPTSPGAPA